MTDDIKKLIARARDEANATRNSYYTNAPILDALADALRAAIQPVLDAWNIPGIRPDYYDSMMFALKREWPMLYNALSDLSRAIDTKEPAGELEYTTSDWGGNPNWEHFLQWGSARVEIATYQRRAPGPWVPIKKDEK